MLGELAVLLANDPYWSICLRIHSLLTRKRGYYGCRRNPLENAMGVQADGITPWKYQLARIGEKCRRLRGDLGTLAIEDTLADIAGHAIVGIAVLHADSKGNSDESADR